MMATDMKKAALPLLYLVLVALFTGCASQQQALPVTADQSPAGAQTFNFANDPWINLHHFLYQWAQAEAGGRSALSMPERTGPSPLSTAEEPVWREAVGYYQKEVISSDLTFDQKLVEWKTRISEVSSRPQALASLPQPLAGHLEKAMPVYQRHWWPGHQAVNRAWIEAVRPKLEKFGPTLLRRLAEVYGGTLPGGSVRVDVSAYSHRVGAYTTVEPNHIVIASSDPDLKDYHSLEILVHEVSHVNELEGPLSAMLARGFAKSNATPPDNLWHTMIFYTVGEITNEALQSAGLPTIVPYPERTGMYRRLPAWDRYRQALDRSWKDYLAGRLDRDAAIDRLVQDLQAKN